MCTATIRIKGAAWGRFPFTPPIDNKGKRPIFSEAAQANPMDGTVKYFNANRGFGFIVTPGEMDRFFHISQVNDSNPPRVGDTVAFELASGRDGRSTATNIQITSRKPTQSERPYYGKPKYRTVMVPKDTPAAQHLVGGAILGAIGLAIGGPIGGLIGAGLGAALAQNTEGKEVEITSPCIRCGGAGQITASVNGWTGFQCKTCSHFWRVRDDKLK